MEFCPDCKGILMPQKDGNNNVLACVKCGYKKGTKTSFTIKTAQEHSEIQSEIEIVNESDSNDLLPKTSAKCPDCNHGEAFYWSLQTRASDEPETKFYRCVSCKKTWRDYK